MFTKLIIPLDGSSIAEGAVVVAASIARQAGAAIDLVLVDQPFPFDGLGRERWTAPVVDEERDYLAAMAEHVASAVAVRVTHGVLRGEPTDKICQRLGDVHADLVVMTSHGRTGIARLWLGSVADSVLRYATTPVLVLRGLEGRGRVIPEKPPFAHVLVPSDGSAWSAEILPPATALAECSDARITLLRVVQPATRAAETPIPFAYTPTLVDEGETEHRVTEARAQLADEARRLRDATTVPVDWHVVVAPAIASAIVEFARTNAVDLVAMATHGRGMSRYLLGSIADKVLRGSDAPMLLYRPLAARTRVSGADAASELAHA